MNSRILIIGGYGVFGGKLARALVKSGYTDVIVAGRSLTAAEAFCREAGGTPRALDTGAADLAAQGATCR
ncbi:KR domain-containing protein [Hyphomonas sp. WL0036]|uniref:NAD(P)-binding domain-containing protein n=1 Tax=Hyphomonas sediminis TaxID=2866160 RepID=UPI001C826FDB|nr:NAD(P)-binding domain-containing protein [Hyphomonas sediminis]MBY9066592.1 KR domain-containing protein [Hyphomonas sediminis]